MKGTREDAGAYAYEVEMLLASLNLTLESPGEGSTNASERAAANAYLESYLVHVRNLIEFFLSPARTRDDDILASDFLESAWTPSGEHVDRLRGLVDEIHKRLSHLTRRRHVDFEYEVLRTTADLVRLNNDFQRQLSTGDPSAADWFRRSINAVEAFRGDWLIHMVRTTSGPPSDT
jgi:hypothetical protein